uniref:Uncharacterized protein n=1 Tax=Arundo donax TaxID=35708 RepID=A0A0A9AJY6_ARUDO
MIKDTTCMNYIIQLVMALYFRLAWNRKHHKVTLIVALIWTCPCVKEMQILRMIRTIVLRLS